MSDNVEYTLEELANHLRVGFHGDATLKLSGLATLDSAGPAELSLYHNPRYFESLQSTRAGAVIISKESQSSFDGNMLVADNPYVCFAKASQLFKKREVKAGVIHPSAHIDPSSILGNGVSIGANVVIEANAEIKANTHVGANCVIGRNVTIGEECWLHPNVNIYEECKLGARVIAHSGVVIGADGFGFAFDGEQHVKIEQLGSVVIGDDVEIGANTCIDRGALDNTVIGGGVKIDNQVQIAHNVQIGEKSIICGCSAIAGSAKIGANCIIAGAVGVINHVNICDDVTVTAMSLVNQDIKKKGVYSSGTGLSETSLWKRNMLRFRDLDAMAKKLKVLGKN